MHSVTPADRDRAQRRVRRLTAASVGAAGVLTLAGAAVAAGTFSGRTVSAADPSAAQGTTNGQPTADPAGGLQQPDQAPGGGFQGGGGVPSGGS